MKKTTIIFTALIFSFILFTAGIATADCDESCMLKSQGKGKILVEVTFKGKTVSAGGLEDKAIIKVLTVKPRYMKFHDQGGLPVDVGRHVVQVFYPGRENVRCIVFVKSGEIKIVSIEIGKPYKPVEKTVVTVKVDPKLTVTVVKRIVVEDCPTGKIIVWVPEEPCDDCGEGQRVIPQPDGSLKTLE